MLLLRHLTQMHKTHVQVIQHVLDILFPDHLHMEMYIILLAALQL